MNKFLIVLAVSILILISGCAQLAEPKKLFSDLREKGKQLPNGKFNYKLDVGGEEFQEGSLLNALSFNIDVYSYNNQIKRLISSSLLGDSFSIAKFKKNSKNILCMDAAILSGSGSKCLILDEEDTSGIFQTDITLDLFKNYDIELAGEKSYAGRECSYFIIKIDSKGLKDASNLDLLNFAKNLKNVKLTYDICLDKQYGFPVYLKTELKGSTTANKEITAFNGLLELKEFSTSISATDIDMPTTFGIASAECKKTKTEIAIISFKEVSSAEFKTTIKPYSYQFSSPIKQESTSKIVSLSNLKFAEMKEFAVQIDKDLNANRYSLEVCYGKECKTSDCYVSTGQTVPLRSE